ncbi:helix-turn-helix transcriptional regulator [Psychroserpens sp.]
MKNSIKIERARYDMTQSDLADKIGVSRQSINAIEKGKYVPSALLAIKIAKLFKLPVEDLFFLEEGE